VSADDFAVVRRRSGVGAHQTLPQQMEVHAPSLAASVFPTEAEVDHHDPPVSPEHVRRREVAMDDPGPMQSTDHAAHLARHLEPDGTAAVQDLFEGRSRDVFHPDLGPSEVDVVDDRDGDSGGAGLRHEARFGPDPRSTEPVIEFRQPIRFRHANLVHGWATEELGPPEFGLGPPFDQHTHAMWAGDKNLSSMHLRSETARVNRAAGGIARPRRPPLRSERVRNPEGGTARIAAPGCAPRAARWRPGLARSGWPGRRPEATGSRRDRRPHNRGPSRTRTSARSNLEGPPLPRSAGSVEDRPR